MGWWKITNKSEDVCNMDADDISFIFLSFSLRCHYGYKCRYLGAHMDAEGKLVRDEEKMARVEPQTLNQFPHELTIKLRSYKVRGSRDDLIYWIGV